MRQHYLVHRKCNSAAKVDSISKDLVCELCISP